MRVLLLTHARLVPPARPVGRAVRRSAPWRTEYDVRAALLRLGHQVELCGVDADLGPLARALAAFKPAVVFNLLEQLGGEAVYDWLAVAHLELIRQPYTGCNPRGLLLSRDKALCKTILAASGLPVPAFAVFPRGDPITWPASLRGPLIIKPLVEQASLGVAQASVVRRPAELRQRVAYLHRRFDVDAIAEVYLPGRELYLGLLGNRRPQVLPPWELRLSGLPRGAWPIASERVKWNRAYQRRCRVRAGPARLAAPVARRLIACARRAYQVLGLSGCARLDFRLADDGTFAIVDVNPNPQLAEGEELAQAAAAARLDYPTLVGRLLRLGTTAPAEPRFFGWAGALSRR